MKTQRCPTLIKRKNIMKHLPFTLVALGMIFSMIPMAGYAEEDSTQITRDGVTYEIVSSSILCICSFVSLKFRSQCTVRG